MKIVITEDQKKKLFAPIGLSGEDSRYVKLNKEQPIVDGVQINQYTHDGKKTGYWEEYYEDGELWRKGEYVNDKMGGIWEYYYGNGKLRSKVEYKNDRLLRRLPLTEAETPKKKLFAPIGLDKRDEQFNNEIKKFLISIKDSFVWDIVGKIYVAYNYETDWSDISYYDKNNQWMEGFRLEKAFNDLYGEKYSIQDFNKALDNITGFMDNLIFAGEDITYGWCEIEYKGDGHLDFTQHKEIKVEEKMMEIKI